MLKNKPPLGLLALSVIFSVFDTSVVLADQYHYNNMLIGNRASGLAGSYVAVSDDPSGLYYNPSGIVYSTTGNVTANMNAYNISQTTYKGALTKASINNQPGEKVDYVRTSAALVPNFFGITQPLGSGTVGFSYAITDSTLEDQGQTFKDIYQAGTKYSINFNNQDATNNVGPSYAFSVNDKFSVGLTLYGYFRNQKLIGNEIVQLPAELDGEGNLRDPFQIINAYSTIDEYGIKPILGFMYSPIEKLSLGLTISQTFILSSNVETQTTQITNICPTDGVIQRCELTKAPYFDLTRKTSDITRELPWEINFGGAYFYSNKLMLTGNIWLYDSTLTTRPDSGNALHDALHYTLVPLVNVAAGAEYYITGKIAMRIGTYTNFANTPIKPNNSENEHIDIIGTTLSFTHFTRSSAISIGAAGTYGSGKAKISPNSSNIQNVEYVGLSVFLSASNSF